MSAQRTPLYQYHVDKGARFIEFAGFDMPVSYADMGLMAEHHHTRSKAGVFDVSHMGQLFISGATDPADALEAIIPSDLKNQKIGKQRYTVLLNEDGGIIDDLIVARLSETAFYIVINAARIENDLPAFKTALGDDFDIALDRERALIALQGPKAVDVMSGLYPKAAELKFMSLTQDGDIIISRSGYTGEDGFEISVPNDQADALMQDLLAHSDVALIGLGARDSLRLEAGLCLYGHDLDTETSPVEAGLTWVIQKSRREAANFNGADRILSELETTPNRVRVGLLPGGRAPLREGVELFEKGSEVKIGQITSGTFSPTLEKPISMGYIGKGYAEVGTEITARHRGKIVNVTVTKLPFLGSK